MLCKWPIQIELCYINITYSPLAASLAAYFAYQMATSIHMDVSSKTLSASHL